MPHVTMTWDGEGDTGEVLDPTTATLQSRIRRLDGRLHTLVALQSELGFLAVGGSADAGLVVYADLGDGTFWTARGPDTPTADVVTVVAGGQPGEYPARFVTTIPIAEAAAREFLASGGLSADVAWEQS